MGTATGWGPHGTLTKTPTFALTFPHTERPAGEWSVAGSVEGERGGSVTVPEWGVWVPEWGVWTATVRVPHGTLTLTPIFDLTSPPRARTAGECAEGDGGGECGGRRSGAARARGRRRGEGA